jgi:hypothetical protein
VALLPTATEGDIGVAAGAAVAVGVVAYVGSVVLFGVPGSLGLGWPRRAAGQTPNP